MRLSIALVILIVSAALAGCQDDAVSRDVKPAEVEQSNARRQDYVDSLNIPDEQKAKMKEHLGGENRGDAPSGPPTAGGQ